MKTSQWVALLSAFAVTVPAFSAEKFESEVIALNNSGRYATYRFTLEIGKLTTGQFDGEIKSWNSKICGSARAIKGELKPGGEVNFETEESPIRGCGKLAFVGKKEGDTSLVGKMKFQGEEHEFVFKK